MSNCKRFYQRVNQKNVADFLLMAPEMIVGTSIEKISVHQNNSCLDICQKLFFTFKVADITGPKKNYIGSLSPVALNYD